MVDEVRIFPRSSAFEALLAKVYLELWDIQDDPIAFTRRVEKFVKVFLPTMFQTKVGEKLPDFKDRLAEMEANVSRLEQTKRHVDPFTEELIDRGSIPTEEAEVAEEVWHATVDILTKAGFNFPMATSKPRRQMRA